MFSRKAFGLIALAVAGSVGAVYASLADTPFFPPDLQTTPGECPENRYYPAHRRPVLEPHEASWFRGQLRTVNEEPLFRADAGRSPTLRFTLLSNQVVTTVRLTKVEGGRLHMTAKWLHPCADERGCGVRRLLSPEEQARVEAALEPLLRVPSYGCNGPVDSGSSILESRDGDTYRLWHQRSSPTPEMAAAASLLLQLSEWPTAHEFYRSASRA
ncbi:hypothetical protein [Brevundimonas sp. M20]|uniref:hypothetical protein n=1 Tax=Brevundimonas sp. M20 TaxID=2591463 RepID=UPI001146C4BA|nr:hypothetical protein [Brevundimonas sp. M20]QDH73397.1 hypothetical protein FKQ52_08120 [Brevundimonas sp. M20]